MEGIRGYVISTGDEADLPNTVDTKPIGIASSKKQAITACETYLKKLPGDAKIAWGDQSKHTGYARKGNFTTSYEMFFINKFED